MGFLWLCRRLIRIFIDVTVILLIIALLPGFPPNVSFTSYELDECLPLEGPLAKNNELDAADRILDGKIVGPESIASRDPEEIFVSLHGGKILRIWGPRFDHFKTVAAIGPGCDGPWQESVCGRPLGLRFAPDGRLIVVDAYLGLFAVDVDTGNKELLFDIFQEIDGAVPKIPDDLDIDAEGNIYWSDASTVCTLEDGIVEFFSDPSGRLIKFDPKTKTNTVLVKNVHFANGVQLSPDQDFILFCETFRNRVKRYWLKGPKAGQTDVFVDRLPGMPDNIRDKDDGGYYVSLVSVPNDFSRKGRAIMAKLPLVRKLIIRLLFITKLLFKSFDKFYPNQYTGCLVHKILNLQPVANVVRTNLTIVVELDKDGNIINSLQGNSGKIQLISETKKVGNNLFFGSPYNKYLGRFPIGVSFIEVEGQGVRIKTEKTPAVQKEEEQVEKKVLLNDEKIQDIELGEVDRKIGDPVIESEEKSKKPIIDVETNTHNFIREAERKQSAEDIQEEVKAKQKVEDAADLKREDVLEKESTKVFSEEKQVDRTENAGKEEL
ncbi:adipocyte plasma membrane-associated protein Hemomucin [Procambarus clarkii]|uniref:adipocyte plasma membrane-associated protein Hemomucin n=1 Tax=Procambarus clarkii TaxID=6728 RepID=UPI001E676113|nr:adipocyte plasma membrane-associated protein-like [Procambarus clarkii]